MRRVRTSTATGGRDSGTTPVADPSAGTLKRVPARVLAVGLSLVAVSLEACDRADRAKQRRGGHQTLAILMLVTVLLAACGTKAGEQEFLVPFNSVITLGARLVKVGEPLFVGLVIPKPKARQPVHLLRVKILEVPDGMVIDGVWAVRFSEYKGNFVGVTRGDEEAKGLRPHYHPVTDVVLDPRCPPEARCFPAPPGGGVSAQDWFLVAEYHITKPGRFDTAGFEVTAKVGGRTLTQSFDGKRFYAKSGP